MIKGSIWINWRNPKPAAEWLAWMVIETLNLNRQLKE